MSHWFTPAKTRLAAGTFDWDSHDIRLMLVMTNTTADTEVDKENPADLATLDEYDGSGYSRPALATEVITQDDSNHRAELSATSPVSFGATVGAGTRSAAGFIVYRHVDGTAANDLLIAYVDSGGFPINGGGGAFQVAINAEGLLQVA